MKRHLCGEWAAGIPRGAAQAAPSLFTYHFNYYGTSGIEDYVGTDRSVGSVQLACWAPCLSPWTVRLTSRCQPTRPIAVQPLDAEGKAVQLMRSWFTAMPGERVTCIGCHEDANNAPPQYGSWLTRWRADADHAAAWPSAQGSVGTQSAAGPRQVLRGLRRGRAARREPYRDRPPAPRAEEYAVLAVPFPPS